MPAEVCPRQPLESRGRPAQSKIPGLATCTADWPDVAEVMDTFVHRLKDQPTCGALLAGQTRRDAVSVPFFRTGNMLAETRNSCREFIERGW